MARTILNKPEGTSDLLQKVHMHRYFNHAGVSDANSANLWRTNNFTTTTENATLIVMGQLWGISNYSDQCGPYCQILDSSNNIPSWSPENNNIDSARHRGCWYAGVDADAQWATFLFKWNKAYTGVTPGTYKIAVGWRSRSGGSGEKPFKYIDPIGSSGNVDNRSQQADRYCLIYECKPDGGISGVNMTWNNW